MLAICTILCVLIGYYYLTYHHHQPVAEKEDGHIFSAKLRQNIDEMCDSNAEYLSKVGEKRPSVDGMLQMLARMKDGAEDMAMERWRDGEMERWRDGEMERWRDGEMERWRDGEMERGFLKT
jgi:hypothetical protein